MPVSRRLACFAAAILIVCARTSAADSKPEAYRHDVAGFELQIPAGWHRVKALRNPEKSKSRISKEDAQLRADFARYANTPLVLLGKDGAPRDALQPSVLVDARLSADAVGKTRV
jgi:hypothetical protein